MGTLLVFLQTSLVTTVVAPVQQAFGASTAQLQWLNDAYSLPLACLLLSAGTAADRWGHRRVFVLGATVLALGGLLAVTAGSITMLIAAVTVQGVGAAMILPAALAAVTDVHPPGPARGRAIGVWAAMIALGVAAGPVAAGALLAAGSWRWAFLIAIPLGMLATLLGASFMPNTRIHEGRQLDPAGQLSGLITIAALTFAVVESGSVGWSPRVLGAIGITVVAGVVFVLVELRSPGPMLQVRLLRSPMFGTAALVAVLVMFGLTGTVFVLSLYFQTVLGYTTWATGIRFLALSGVLLLTAPLAGRVAARTGPRWPMTAGLITAAAGLLAMTTISPGTGFAGLWPQMVLVGAGFGFVLAPMTDAAVSAVPATQAGMAAAATNAFRQIGGVLGVAVLGAILTGAATHAQPVPPAVAFLAGLHAAAWTAGVAMATGALATAVLIRSPRPNRTRTDPREKSLTDAR